MTPSKSPEQLKEPSQWLAVSTKVANPEQSLRRQRNKEVALCPTAGLGNGRVATDGRLSVWLCDHPSNEPSTSPQRMTAPLSSRLWQLL